MAGVSGSGRGGSLPLRGSEPKAGPYLDRMIELRVFGRKPAGDVPPYSTNEEEAERVIARLNKPPLRWMSLKDGNRWTFHWRKPVAVPPGRSKARYIELVTATGSTRPLAICRAALKLLGPLGPSETESKGSGQK